MREPAFWYRPSSWISIVLSPLGAFYGLISAQRLQRDGGRLTAIAQEAGVPLYDVAFDSK